MEVTATLKGNAEPANTSRAGALAAAAAAKAAAEEQDAFPPKSSQQIPIQEEKPTEGATKPKALHQRIRVDAQMGTQQGEVKDPQRTRAKQTSQ